MLGGYGFGETKADGEQIHEFCDATNMVVGNTMFSKRPSRLVTYKSGSLQGRATMMKFVKDVKVITGKECSLQHRLVVYDLTL